MIILRKHNHDYVKKNKARGLCLYKFVKNTANVHLFFVYVFFF